MDVIRICLVLALGMASSSVWAVLPSGLDRSRFLIGAYHFRKMAHTEQHVKDFADCGMDYAIVLWKKNPQLLDWFAKYKLGAVLWDALPEYWDLQTRKRFNIGIDECDKALAQYVPHPAVWFYNIIDEPSTREYQLVGEIAARSQKLDPVHTPHVCLYPSYAFSTSNAPSKAKDQLGAKDYETYIAEYCEKVPLDYIHYDFYPYALEKIGDWYEALRIVSDACHRTGRSLWVTAQANSTLKTVFMSENQLRFQAYSALAFGCECINWACYTFGWWENNIIDEQGNKTVMYDRVKKVNFELKTLTTPYMRYRNTQTHFVGFAGTEWAKSIGQQPVDALNAGWIRSLRATDGSPLVVGEMVNRNGGRGRAFLVFSADDPWGKVPKHHAVSFTAQDQEVAVFTTSGKVAAVADEKGVYALELDSNQAILICIR